MAFSFYTRKKEEPQSITDWSQYQSKPQTNSSKIVQSAMSGSWKAPAYTPKTPTSVVQQKTTNLAQANKSANQAYSQRPDIQAMVKAKQQPQVQPTPEQTKPTGYDAILARMKALADSRIAGEDTRATSQMSQLEALEAERQGKKSKQIETLEGLKQRAVDRIRAVIPEQEQLTAEQKASIEDVYGQEERSDLRRRADTGANLQKTFANLGSIDSSVFQQASERQAQAGVEASSARGRAKAMELAQADRDLVAVKRKAEADVDTEVFNFENALYEIENTYGQGTQDYYNAVNSLMQTTSDRIYSLQQGVLDAEMGVENLRAESMASGAGNAELKDKQALSLSASNAIGDLYQDVSGNENIYKNINPFDQSKRDYDAKVANAIDLIIRTRTGAAATEEEVKAMRGMFPTFLDNKQTALDKLTRLNQSLDASLLGTPYQTSQLQSNAGQVVTAPDGQQIIIVDG